MKDKLPYGSGSVIFVKANTRNPYMARRYKGTNQQGKPSYKSLGTFPIQMEAKQVLLDKSDASANDLINEKLTLFELFIHFMDTLSEHYAEGTRVNIRGLVKKCSDLHDVVYSDIKAEDFREVIKHEKSQS